MSADTSELEALIRDVQGIPAEVGGQMFDIVEGSSKRILHEWRMRWDGHEDIPWLSRAITYDVQVRPHLVMESEIGPEKHRPQGRLGSFIEFGTRTSRPIPGGWPAADAEEPRFVRDVERIKILGME